MQMDWGARTSSSAAFGVSPKASEPFATAHQKVSRFHSHASRRDADWKRSRRSRSPNPIASFRISSESHPRKNDSGRAVSRILSAPKESGERTICLSSRYPKPAPRGGAWSGPLRGFLFGLAPDGVFRALPVARQAVSFYLAFSPLPCPWGRGGLIFCGTVRRKACAFLPRVSSS